MSKESAMAVATASVPIPTTQVDSPAQLSTETAKPLPSTALGQLARKEAELVRQKQEFKKERESLEVDKKRVQEFETKFKQDPVGAIKGLGYSETDIFNYLANQEKPEPTAEEKAAAAAKEAVDNSLKTWEQAQTEKQVKAQQDQDNSLIDGYKRELSKAIESNKDQFEYCSYYGKEAQDLAYEITLAVVKESDGKEVISPEEAIKMAEEYFEMKDNEMMNLRKRQSKFKPSEPTKTAQPERTRTVSTPPTAGEQPKLPTTVSRVRTLTNAATSTVASARINRLETREQKRERLINQLRESGLKKS